MDRVDVIVIGAGVVGLAVAAQLAKRGKEVVVLERHDAIGTETSSRNSEVIHAGIYYPEGSLKARFCVRGKELLYRYCSERNIPFRRCGKIIVASKKEQVPVVTEYIQKANANGVGDLRWIEAGEVAELEPEVKAVGAVLSPSTGIIDSHAFMLSLQSDIESHGGMIAFLTKVIEIESSGANRIVRTPDFELAAQWIINSAGLSAPELAIDTPDAPRGFYAKGHYYSYSGNQPFSRLVYPVAEAGGLGVHVTLDLAGQVKFGPDVRWQDDLDYSFDSSHFHDFVAAIREYYPGIEPARMQEGYTGIRPKISNQGSPAADFLVHGPDSHGVEGRINLLGIESPGLTSSLAIGEYVSGIVLG